MKRTKGLSLMTALGAALLGLAPMTSSAGPAYKLAFTTQPTTTTVGAKLTNVVVQIRSQNNTNVPQSGATVTLTLNKGAYLTGTTSVNTDAGGKATFTNLTILQAGTGNALLAAASGLLSATSSVFTVSQGKTTVALTSSANPAAYGQSVTFTATVTAVAPATGTPTGTVTFKDGSTVLGTGTLNSSGKTTFSTTTRLTAATHSITGVYGGDTNFTGSTSAVLSQTVSKAVLTVSGITASNKVYDATTTAKLNTNSAALVGVLSGDIVTLNVSSAKGVFSDKNVGMGKTVTVSGLTISGTNAANYSLTQPATTASITARSLTVTAKGVNKVYDATTNATVTLSDNRVSGDALTDSYTRAFFTNKTVGTGKPVTVLGIAISGTNAINYALTATTASTTASITAATLTVSGITAANKIYDGKTTATISTNSAALVGVLTGDKVTLNASSAKGVFSDKNVGTSKTVTVSGLKISGTDAGNYSLKQPTATASITARTLTVTATGVNKVYDGTTVATVTLADNRVSGDVLTASYTAAAFADQNAGNGKTVTVSGLTISGTDAGNYALAATTISTTANITKATLTVTAVSLSRVYGAANPTLTATYAGFVNGETLATSGVTGSPSLTTTATLGSPVSGSPYAITVGLGSLSAVNYSFSFVNGTLSVTPASTTVAVVSSLNPACTNQNITFTAKVSATAPSLATPAGTVQFQSNGVNLGSPVTLTGGQASITVAAATLGVGSFNITAVFSDASGNFSGSNNSLTQVVKAPVHAAPCKLALNAPTPGDCLTGTLAGTPGQTYIMQASTDMIHWTAISTNTADANGVISFSDPDSGKYSSRFYRSATMQ